MAASQVKYRCPGCGRCRAVPEFPLHCSCGREIREEDAERCRGKKGRMPWSYDPGEPLSPQLERVRFVLHKGLGDAVCFRGALEILQREWPDLAIEVEHLAWHGDLFRDFPKTSLASAHAYVQFMRPHRGLAGCASNTSNGFLVDVCGLDPARIGPIPYYRLEPAVEHYELARQFLNRHVRDGRRAVLIHPQGRSFAQWKNPPAERFLPLVETCEALGYTPLVIDFDHVSPLAGMTGATVIDHHTFPARADHASHLAALISLSALYVGVDSGPLHVAGMTSTPAIGVWLAHHPAHSYDCAANVIHLVPGDHDRYLPEQGREHVLEFFHKHYRHRVYRDLAVSLARLAEELLHVYPFAAEVHRDVWIRNASYQEDLFIVNEQMNNEYRLDALPIVPRVIVDVGAHCGYFAYECWKRWPHSVLACIEPVVENAALIVPNAPTAVVHVAACTYESEPVRLAIGDSKSLGHTGGSHIVGCDRPAGSRTVARITLDEICDQVGDIDLLKLDCEGSELSILEHAQCLDRVRMIVGEWHDREAFLGVVHRRLPHWTLEVLRDGECGIFWLRRPG